MSDAVKELRAAIRNAKDAEELVHTTVKEVFAPGTEHGLVSPRYKFRGKRSCVCTVESVLSSREVLMHVPWLPYPICFSISEFGYS